MHERRLSAQEERGLGRMERTQKERDDQAVLERRALGRPGLSGNRYTSRYVYSLAKLLSSDHPTIHHRIPNSLVGSLLSLSLSMFHPNLTCICLFWLDEQARRTSISP